MLGECGGDKNVGGAGGVIVFVPVGKGGKKER